MADPLIVTFFIQPEGARLHPMDAELAVVRSTDDVPAALERIRSALYRAMTEHGMNALPTADQPTGPF